MHLPLLLCGLKFFAIQAHLFVDTLNPVQRLVLAGLHAKKKKEKEQ